MLTTFVNALMPEEADAMCGAPYGMPGPDRVNVRNGYRHRDSGTRAGTLDTAIPELRPGSYFPDWLLERRRRAEAALTSVVAACYLLGVSTRRMKSWWSPWGSRDCPDRRSARWPATWMNRNPPSRGPAGRRRPERSAHASSPSTRSLPPGTDGAATCAAEVITVPPTPNPDSLLFFSIQEKAGEDRVKQLRIRRNPSNKYTSKSWGNLIIPGKRVQGRGKVDN
jgi:hypothetical protein